MNHLFRQPNQGLVGYAALTLFAVAYLSAMMLILAPGGVVRGNWLEGTRAPG